MKQPRKPTLDQKKLISKAGLNPAEWHVTEDKPGYLGLIDHPEQRERRYINKQTLEVTADRPAH